MIFEKISKDTRGERSAGGKRVTRPGGLSFVTKSGDDQHQCPKLKCPSCHGEHWLSWCDNFKRKPVEERFKLMCSLKLCNNCLTPGHVARFCEKTSFCKIEGRKFKVARFPASENRQCN